MDLTLSRRALLGAAAATTLSAQTPAPTSANPNVIVILFDDLGLHDLGYLGARDLKTPNIDRLAAGGSVCRNWYSNAPVCAPARSALMTEAAAPFAPVRSGQRAPAAPFRTDHRVSSESQRLFDCPHGKVASRQYSRHRSPTRMVSITSTASTKAVSTTTRTASIGATRRW